MTKSRGILAPRRNWTPDEEVIVRDLYPDVPCADIAALLDRKQGSVYQAAKRLRLEKSDHFQASDMSGRVTRGRQHPSMIATRFKKGQVSWNKGLKGVCGTHPNSRKTQFKADGSLRGAAQHNYVPIGTLRVSKDGYLERKTSDTHPIPARRWIAVHRIVWEQAIGPIPAGHVVCFKPGAKTAVLELITVDRLECISRAELARRNHPRSYSPELAKLVQLKGAITRQVNRIQKENS